MRTKSFSLLALAAVFTLSACGGSQNSNSNSAASGAKATGLDVNKTYIVATDASYAPMEYMENNAVVGFSHDILDAAAKSQNAIPKTCSQQCKYGENKIIHLRETCRNRYKVPDYRDESTYKCRNDTVFIEKTFALL